MLKFQLDKLVQQTYQGSLKLNNWKIPDKLDVFMIKANNFVSIKFRALRQSIDSVMKQSFKDQDYLQKVIKMQINSIFQQQISTGLLNFDNYNLHYFLVSSISWNNMFTYQPKLSKQQKLVQDHLNQIQFFDPDIRALIGLLDSQQQQLRDFTFQYVQKLQKQKNRYNYLKLKDMCPTKKHKIIQILVRSLNKQQQDILAPYQKQYLQCINPNFNKMLMTTGYNLIFIHCLNLKHKLFHILNAQNCIEKSIVSKMYSINKTNIPFQFSDSFNLKFSRYQADQVQQYLNKKQSTTQTELIQQNDSIQYIFQQGQPIPLCIVRCQNRRDNEICFNQNIVYPITQSTYKTLCKKIQKICFYYIQKHQNNLPFSDFNEIIDRYRILEDIFQCELKYNYHKLQLMEQYYSIIQKTSQHQAIFKLSEKIMQIKYEQHVIDLSGRYFVNKYNDRAQTLNKQTTILKRLKTIFIQLQKQANGYFKQRTLFSRIITNQMPEVSLNYYCLDSSLKNKQRIQQEKQQENKVSQQPSNDNYYDNSQYFLQKDFKEYLQNDSNNNNMLEMVNKKRQQLIGFNQKLTVNDEFLGAPMWFGQSINQLQKINLDNFQYLWNILQLIQMLSQFHFQSTVDKLSFYQSIDRYLSDCKLSNISYEQLFDQNMLSVYLQKCSQDITTIQSTLFKYPLNTLSKFQLSTLEGFMNYQKLDFTSYRGLYLSINFVSTIKLSGTFIHNSIMKNIYLDEIISIIKQYAPIASVQVQYFQKLKNSKQLSVFPDLEQILPSQLNVYQYLFPCKSMLFHYQTLYSFSNNKLFQQIFIILNNFAKQYIQSVQNLNLTIQHKCISKNNDSLSQYMSAKQQLKKLEQNKRCTLSKQFLAELIILRDTMHVHRKSQLLQQQNTTKSDIIFHKKYLNKVTNDLRNSAIAVYQLSKYKKYKHHFQILKIDIQKLLKILPFMNDIITISQKQENKQKNGLVFPNFQKIMPDIKVVLQVQNNIKRPQFVKYIYESLQSKSRKYLDYFSNKKIHQFNNSKVLQPIQIQTEYKFWNEVKIFLTSSLLWFSLQLSPHDNLVFRQLIIKGESLQDYLFQSSKHLLSPQYLNRLRRRALQSKLFFHYQKQYRIFDNLKSSYKQFVIEMTQFIDILKSKKKYDNQSIRDNLFIQNRKRQKIIYIALKQLQMTVGKQFDQIMNQLLNSKKDVRLQFNFQIPQYFYQKQKVKSNQHCPYNSKMSNYLKNIVKHSLIEPSQYISKNQYKSDPYISKTIISPINPSLDKLTQQYRRFIQQRVIQLRKLCQMYTLIKNGSKQHQILTAYYSLVRMRQLLFRFEITDKRHQDQKLIKIMEVKHHQGALELSNLQKIVSVHNKTMQNSKIYEKVSQRILGVVVETKIIEQIFKKQIYENYIFDLNNQLKLLQYLNYDIKWTQKFKQQKAIKQLQNKVLVPKIKLNPFFSSPLCLTNYFIPHTSKLAFVQSFLNRLRNKIMQVELIDNQFGFLVKSHDLQECVQFLCKSFISFSEKQYQSRTRKMMLQLQMVESQLLLTKQDLLIEKNRTNVNKTKLQSLLKAQLFTKINSILLSYYNMKNREQDMMQKITSIQTQIHEDLTEKYEQFINSQTNQNQILSKQFKNFKQFISGVYKRDIKLSNELLQSQLSDNMSKILGKRIEQELNISLPTQKQIDYSENQLFQKQLKKQNYLYKLKISTLQQKHESQINQFKKVLDDKQKILNTLLIEKRKSQLLMQQLSSVNQQLKKSQASLDEIKKKHQQTEHKNYRLTRLLQQANLKLNKSNFHLPTIRQNKSSISKNLSSTVKQQTLVRSISLDPSKKQIKNQMDWKQKYTYLKQQNKQLNNVLDSIKKQCQKYPQTKLSIKIMQYFTNIQKSQMATSKIIDVNLSDVKLQRKTASKYSKVKTEKQK